MVDLPGYVTLQAAHDLPLALALRGAPRATYSQVRRSAPIRTTQIRCKARLASRLPPRLSLRRTTLPEEATMGETPQRGWRRKPRSSGAPGCLRLRREASQCDAYRWPARRSALGLLPPLIGAVACPTRRSPPRGPHDGGLPSGAPTWLPSERCQVHYRGANEHRR